VRLDGIGGGWAVRASADAITAATGKTIQGASRWA
jgi:hypothetical protein